MALMGDLNSTFNHQMALAALEGCRKPLYEVCFVYGIEFEFTCVCMCVWLICLIYVVVILAVVVIGYIDDRGASFV